MTDQLKNITEVNHLEGQVVLVRTDFNVPIKDGEIEDDFRIRKALPLLDFLVKNKAKTIIISHIWGDELDSLKVVHNYLKRTFEIDFVSPADDSKVQNALKNIEKGRILMLENLRLDPREVSNDEDFAKKLSSYADIYVNEAFSVSHRSHASVVGLPKYLPSYSGIQFDEEISNLSKAFSPERPFLFILGGAKFETKMPLVEKFKNLADKIFIGGALANDIFKFKGFEIGLSLLSKKEFDLSGIVKSEKIVYPIDVMVKNQEGVFLKEPEEVSQTDNILDAGPKTLNELADLIRGSRFILWNGPLGDYENGFEDLTAQLAKIIAESSAHSIVGGGDSVAIISKLGLENDFDFVSTGGGAMLDFLSDETLVGIEALKESQLKFFSNE